MSPFPLESIKGNRRGKIRDFFDGSPRTWAFAALIPALIITFFICPVAYAMAVLSGCPRVLRNLWDDLRSMFGNPFRRMVCMLRAAWGEIAMGMCGAPRREAKGDVCG